MAGQVQIVEVGPRDGFQSVAEFIPTARKIQILQGLYDAGIRRVEGASFVSSKALPQMADAVEMLAAASAMDGLDFQVLVPTRRQAERALAAGARHLAFVVSVSEDHNRSNVRCSPAQSSEEYAAIVPLLPTEAKLRLNLATAFDCPFLGRVDSKATLQLLETLLLQTPDAEVALCDTTGRATPDRVADLFERCLQEFPGRCWAFHGHDTFGLGAANAYSAWSVGVRAFDASIAGLGGCPYAPGATGNVATEDLVWLFEQLGVKTGVHLAELLNVSVSATDIPGAIVGGRVRDALRARRLGLVPVRTI